MLRFTSVGETIEQRTTTIPIVANVVSASEAASAVPDAEVREEVLVLRAARVRDEAIRLADEGRVDYALAAVEATALELDAAGLTEDAAELRAAQSELSRYDAMSRKALNQKSWDLKRGRGRPPAPSASERRRDVSQSSRRADLLVQDEGVARWTRPSASSSASPWSTAASSSRRSSPVATPLRPTSRSTRRSRAGFAITETSAAGWCPSSSSRTRPGSNALLYDGEELVGAKQNRILNLSVLVGAGAKRRSPSPASRRGVGAGGATRSAPRHIAHSHLRRRKAETLVEIELNGMCFALPDGAKRRSPSWQRPAWHRKTRRLPGADTDDDHVPPMRVGFLDDVPATTRS